MGLCTRRRTFSSWDASRSLPFKNCTPTTESAEVSSFGTNSEQPHNGGNDEQSEHPSHTGDGSKAMARRS